METPESEKKLEKFLKKLENIDIREWTYRPDIPELPHPLTAEICGLNFRIGLSYLEIGDIRGGPYAIHYSPGNIKNKPLKKTLTCLYKTISDKLNEHQKKEVEEKLESFLSG
jgi:hypothetical protein